MKVYNLTVGLEDIMDSQMLLHPFHMTPTDYDEAETNCETEEQILLVGGGNISYNK